MLNLAQFFARCPRRPGNGAKAADPEDIFRFDRRGDYLMKKRSVAVRVGSRVSVAMRWLA